MGKRWAISIVVGMMAVVYIFLLVGVPMLVSIAPSGSSEISDNDAVSNVTTNWTPVGPPLDIRPYWEVYKAPWIIYSIPGLVGTAMIVIILKQGGKADG